MLDTKSSIVTLAIIAISTVVGNVMYHNHLKRLEKKADDYYAKISH